MTPPGVVAVVGGGITGLAAAWALSGPETESRPLRVVVLEAEPRLGGKIETSDFAGHPVDAGPDAFVARAREAVDLCRELGLEGELVAPATNRAFIWTRGRLRPLPTDTVLGVPTSLRSVAASGIVSPLGVARAGLDLVLPAAPGSGDTTVAELVDARLGREVRDRLVDPLLGGIHAGSTEHLSLAVNAPQIAAAARQGRSLLRSLAVPPTDAAAGPVFLSLPGGLGLLVERLARKLAARGVELRTAAPVRCLGREDGRWHLATPQGPVAADAVVLAVPAFVAADLVAPHDSEAASDLAAVEHASVVLVTMAYPADAIDLPPGASGFLVPRVDGRLMTACTWMSAKWPHLGRPGEVLVRVSAGRFGDDRALDMGDEELCWRLHSELVTAMGVSAYPQATRITRWPRSFPQYQVGHVERVDRIEATLAGLPGLVAAGAAYRGVGIPACVGQGRRAASAVLDQLRAGATP